MVSCLLWCLLLLCSVMSSIYILIEKCVQHNAEKDFLETAKVTAFSFHYI